MLSTTAFTSQTGDSLEVLQETATVSPQAADSAWQLVEQGRLENGLRYAILPRRGNEAGVSLRLRVTGGFLAEQRPGERGLAHLIEHVVFHSPTLTAPSQLRRFREVGFPLSLPEPAGATTSWRESDYFIVSRTTQSADLDALLALFREVFSELTFRPDAVDGQRAEVMREMADKRLGNDIYADYIAAVAPGSPNDVIDAQNSDDVPTASTATIRNLYHRLYRPENITIVIVGDVDPRAIKALIQRRFGNWRGAGPAPARTAIPTFNRERIGPISYSGHPYSRNVALLTLTMPLPPVQASRAGQAETILMDSLAFRAASNRLALTRADYPPGKYGMFIENGEQGHRTFIFWDEFVPGRWRPAVAGLSGTMCNLRVVGFSEQEWTTAEQQLLEELDRQTNAMSDASNFGLAMELANALTYGRALIPPNELLLHARTWLPTIGAKQGSDWWRRQWSAGTQHLRVETPEMARINDPVAMIKATAHGPQRDNGCDLPSGK